MRPGDRRGATAADAARLAMRGLLRPLAGAGRRSRVAPGRRRLVLLQLDGVSRRRLERALADGTMPFLAARLRSGRHVLAPSRSGAPASTPAFQAGLFYGADRSVPGFAWVDRATGREVRMDAPRDAAELERRLPRAGPGLLRGGTSYFSILGGEAANPHFCLSGVAGGAPVERAGPPAGFADALAAALVHSVGAARAALRVAAEAGAGAVDGLRWSLALGRARHEPRFFVHRLLVSAVLRELAVQNVLVDLWRGVPVVFADFLGYDEFAHRRGPEARLAARNLAAADAAVEVICAAAEAVPELGYDVYVLSDHGNVPTRPFEELTGLSLAEYVALARRGARPPAATRRVGPPPARRARAPGAARVDGIAVAEAGDLAHVYFLSDGGPLPLAAVRQRHWRVLAALTASRAVGILAARGGRRGLALVRGAVLDLADPADVARLPHPDPALAATYLSDLVAVPDSGDLVVLGWRGEGRPTVAYAWEFGSHGGIDPEGIESFVVHPRGVRFPFEAVIRPSELYRFFHSRYRAAPEEAERAAGAP